MKRSLDLHGKHIHEAWKSVDRFLQQCYYDNYKSCEIICGQGLIRNEIETWLHLNTFVREYRFNTRTQGSYNVKLKKRKTT
jgi:DNA-nicking Smr family endonuclease